MKKEILIVPLKHLKIIQIWLFEEGFWQKNPEKNKVEGIEFFDTIYNLNELCFNLDSNTIYYADIEYYKKYYFNYEFITFEKYFNNKLRKEKFKKLLENDSIDS